jgi:hypothetical protein
MAWYHAATADAEFWFGPADTRDAAIANGRVRHGPGRLWVAEGKPFEADLRVFEPDVAPVVDRFDSINGEIFGEDGEGSPLYWDEEACSDLSRRLNATFAEWATKHGYQRGWQLDLGDAEEVRPTLTLARSARLPDAASISSETEDEA